MTWTCTAFHGTAIIAEGPVRDVVGALHARFAARGDDGVLVFDDRTGRAVDFDLTGTAADAQTGLERHPLWPKPDAPPSAGRGRPRLGVVGREVSLLPRHWAWLEVQKGSASATLRRLVEAAIKADVGEGSHREGVDRAHRFLWTLAGDLPGFEEASRALYAGDRDAFAARTADWPADVRAYADRLLAGDGD